MGKRLALSGIAVMSLASQLALADGFLGADQGKLHLTAGFSTLEGAGGGGLTPWAFITGYGSDESWGANAFATEVLLRDVELRSFGAAVGVLDRFELSYSRQELEFFDGPLDQVGVSLDTFGVKVRVFGNAVYAQDTWLPQVAVGAQFKRHGGVEGLEGLGITSVEQLGAGDTDGIDYYVSATKLSLSMNFLLNVTVRATQANQLGLLGFGGSNRPNGEDRYYAEFETTIAYLLTRKLAIGGEYRTRPDNLNVDEEAAAWDAFIAWTPSKYVSILGAYANIGALLGPQTQDTSDQDGGYLSIQVGF